jgi:Ca2+-binding RTX toxin-like protein
LAGDDTLNGGAGADILQGSWGVDTADYSTSADGVNVSIASGIGSGGDAEGDTLLAIENVLGSAVNDTLTGDINANFLNGLAGDDTLNGGAGADILQGGSGADRFEFFADQGQDAVIDYEQGTDHIAIADFVKDGIYLLFNDLDSTADGVLDDADSNVENLGNALKLDLTPYAPGGTQSELVLSNVNQLHLTDFV